MCFQTMSEVIGSQLEYEYWAQISPHVSDKSDFNNILTTIIYQDGNDDPVPNSLFSLIRLFDKKKMEYFDGNYKENSFTLKSGEFNKDCLDDEKQLKLINKIIEKVSIEPE